MSMPDLATLQQSAQRIVHEGERTQSLHTLTVRVIFKKLEEMFGLDSGSLEELRKPIKAAVNAAIDDVKGSRKETPGIVNPTDESSSPGPTATARKRKPEGDRTGSEKKARTASPTSEESAPPVASATKTTASDNPSKKSNKKGDSTKYKSSEFISSDIDLDTETVMDEGSNIFQSNSEAKKRDGKKRSTPGKPIAKPLPSTSKAEPSKTKVEESTRMEAHESKAESQQIKSDSELSVLFDEPSKPKKARTKESSATTQKERKKAGPQLSKDEETVKRLKGLVNACGVRKVWSKVFKDLDQPSQQVSKLKSILNELGMTGRFSLEKAKAIKAERELAKELEDVQTFEKAMVAGGPRNSSKVAEATESENEGNGSDSEAKAPSRRRRVNARASIIAFLADQSDDE